MRLKPLLVAAGTSAALAACSSAPAALAPLAASGTVASAPTSKTTTVKATSTPTPTPTPTLWSKAEAAKRYLAIVAPSNKATDQLRAAVDTNNSKKVRAACKTLLAADDKFMRDLDAGRWAPNIRPLVDDVMASVASTRSVLLGCAQSKTRAELVAALAERPNDPHEGAAQTLRVRLGLPGTG